MTTLPMHNFSRRYAVKQMLRSRVVNTYPADPGVIPDGLILFCATPGAAGDVVSYNAAGSQIEKLYYEEL